MDGFAKPAGLALHAASSDNSPSRTHTEDAVHISEIATGLWSVGCRSGRRGGRFSDLKAAQRFVRREFGQRAKI